MQVITSKIPYVGYSHNAEHNYLFNKLVEAIPLAFATKHNFTAYHDRMTRALADENASYTRTAKFADTETVSTKDEIRDNQFRRLKLQPPPPRNASRALARKTQRGCLTSKTPPPCATSSTSWNRRPTPRR